MTTNRKSNHSHITARRTFIGNNERFIIDADLIGQLIAERHPMIMVDLIIDYKNSPLELSAERYISANEPVFTCHFPNLKLWPGIYTIEGLRQCCKILDMLQQLEEADLLDEIINFQKNKRLRSKVNKMLSPRVKSAIEEFRHREPSPLKIRVKLLAPVFAGCIIEYKVRQLNKSEAYGWLVVAEVNGQTVAKGSISQNFSMLAGNYPL